MDTRRRLPLWRISWLLAYALFATGARGAVSGAEPARSTGPVVEPTSELAAALPQKPLDFSASTTRSVAALAAGLDDWAARVARFPDARTADDYLRAIDRLAAAKKQVDALVDRTLAVRVGFAALDADDRRRSALENHVRTVGRLFDLSGRLRYTTFDAVNDAVDRFGDRPAVQEQLVDLLIERRSSIGAASLAPFLVDSPADVRDGPPPVRDELKVKLLRLIEVTGQVELISDVADMLRDRRTPASLVVLGAQTIRKVGLPQDPLPDQDPTLPKPVIAARELRDILARLAKPRLSRQQVALSEELVTWLDGRIAKGVTEDAYRLGGDDVRPGDWLLMRNPSPYNLFSDLSPGLFTHVGVVAATKDSRGIRHVVVVDLPERGTRIPATNVDVFVQRTLHYMLLRHDDPAAARKMADAAASIVGNESQFDLNFRTARVTELKGKPLAGAKITTYCAGLLLLCAQETGRPRDEFFPIRERAGGGRLLENMAKLGASIGDDFISPTGPLYSPRLTISGRCEPMYDPGREIEQAIYDQFAVGMRDRTLAPSVDQFKSLRTKLAEASKTNPLLAKALARAANVNESMDLVAAAKTAAVVETLDEVAYGHSGEFRLASESIKAGPLDRLPRGEYTPREIAEMQSLRRRHADLFRRWEQDQIAPRELRIALVRYYVDEGRRQIDQRFFGVPASSTAAAKQPEQPTPPRRRRFDKGKANP